MIGSSTKEHIFLDNFPLFDFEMFLLFLFLGVGLLIGGNFFVLDKGVEQILGRAFMLELLEGILVILHV